MQRQILNIEVRITPVVFTRRSSVSSCLRLLLLGRGRFLDGLWSIKAGSEHQFRTIGWTGPCSCSRWPSP